MIRTKKRLYLCCTLLVINLAFIWGNSLLPGSVSSVFSNWVRDLLASLFGGTPGESTGGGLLRKLAHFTEFACLGLCLRWLFGMVRTGTWQQCLPALLCGFCAACIDETIQIFVPNRGPGIPDVLLDTLGVAVGIGLLTAVHTIWYEKAKENTQ